jgi:protein O-GlcNAc transferase
MSDVNQAFATAVAKHQAGDRIHAETLYRDILTRHGSHAPTLCNLGVLLVQAGKLDEALQQYHLALATTPNYPDAHFNLGNLYRKTNQLAEAEKHYRSCLEHNPKHAAAAFNLGLVYSSVGDMPSSVEAFRLVASIEPTNPDAFSRLGDAFIRSGRASEGIAAFRKTVDLKPNEPRHLYNLGLALANAGLSTEAGEVLNRTIQLSPNYAEAHNALGLNLEAQGRKDDAIFHYQKAVELKPDLSDGWSNLGTSLSEQGRCEDAINCLRESLKQKPHSPQIHSNLLLLLNYSSDVTVEEIAQEHTAWATQYITALPDAPRIPEPHDAGRKLKIGYISGDFRQHTVSGFAEVLFTHHDRSQVDVYAYGNILRPDDVTDRLKKLADHYRPIGGLPDEQVFYQMQADQLDILIDLSGHTAGNRLQLMAARPAPVQCTLFGYPNTTGLSAIDYRITDPISDPEGTTEALSVEKLLRLPQAAWCYAPPKFDIPVGPLPCLSKKTFTFGCLNNPAKISEACLEIWAKLLQAIPGTRLMLLGGQSNAGAKRLAERFMKAGVLRDRVEILPRTDKTKYFETYHQFDIALDPFPYNGGVTTGDAMWMGVPVLTVAGYSYVSRQGLMANASVGLTDFIADSPATLISLAKQWTQRRPELAEIRAGLRDRLMRSPLGDAKDYVEQLELALREVWSNRLER